MGLPIGASEAPQKIQMGGDFVCVNHLIHAFDEILHVLIHPME